MGIEGALLRWFESYLSIRVIIQLSLSWNRQFIHIDLYPGKKANKS